LLSLAQQAALKDQQKRGGVNLYCADFPRVRGPERRATRWRRLGGGWPPSPTSNNRKQGDC
jgi:hypothetical protein